MKTEELLQPKNHTEKYDALFMDVELHIGGIFSNFGTAGSSRPQA